MQAHTLFVQYICGMCACMCAFMCACMQQGWILLPNGCNQLTSGDTAVLSHFPHSLCAFWHKVDFSQCQDPCQCTSSQQGNKMCKQSIPWMRVVRRSCRLSTCSLLVRTASLTLCWRHSAAARLTSVLTSTNRSSNRFSISYTHALVASNSSCNQAFGPVLVDKLLWAATEYQGFLS